MPFYDNSCLTDRYFYQKVKWFIVCINIIIAQEINIILKEFFLKLKKVKFIKLCWHFIAAGFLIFIFFASESNSQTRVDSLEYLGRFFNSNILRTGFDKQLNTFHLYSNLKLFGNFDKVLIRLNENFSSTFIRNETKNVRDEQHLNFSTMYLYDKNVSFGLAGNSSLLSDNRSLGINESAVNFATIFTEIQPISNVRVSPFGGYLSNRQIGVTDFGNVYGIEGTLDKLNFSDLDINSELRFRNEDILPRRNLIRYYTLSVGNNFDRSINNNIRTNYSQSRKDFYFEADSITSTEYNINNNIQSRTETAYQIFDRLSYDGFLDLFSLDLSGGINWRNIDRDTRFKTSALQTNTLYDTRIEELKLEFDAIVRYTSNLFNGIIRFNFYERDEKHLVKRFDGLSEQLFEQKSELEEQKNNNSNRATLSFSGNLKISNRDNLTFSLYQSKLIYDTRSQTNDDDRDEILSIIRIRYLRNLSSYFSAFINTEYTYGHTVYLFASRSSNNNENRILRFRAGGEYYGKHIRSFNSFEVSANYTVYDFEDITTNYQSYSFRQFTAIDSTTIKLTDKTSFFTYGYLKLSEVGDFSWNNFSARPTRFLQELYLEPRFILNYYRTIFSVGVRLFSLNTYSYKKGEKQIDTEFLSIGPMALIDILAWNNLNLIFKGYYEFISNTDQQNKEQASLLMQVNWKF